MDVLARVGNCSRWWLQALQASLSLRPQKNLHLKSLTPLKSLTQRGGVGTWAVYSREQKFRPPQAIVRFRNCKLEMKFIRLLAEKPSSGSATANSQRTKAALGKTA